MKKSDEDLKKKWTSRITRAKECKKKWEDTFKVDLLDQYWEGAQVPEEWADNQFVPINLMYANVKSTIDTILLSPPKVHVRPARTLYMSEQNMNSLDAQIDLRESLCGTYLSSRELAIEVKKSILDCYPSFGVLKVFYEPVHEPHPRAGQQMVIDDMSLVDDNGNPRTYPEKRLTDENFLVKRRNPSDIYLDPDADSLETIEWVGERVTSTLGELKGWKKDLGLRNLDEVVTGSRVVEDKKEETERKVGGEGLIGSVVPATGGNSSLAAAGVEASLEDDEKPVHYLEIYDLVESRLLWVCENNGVIIRDDEMPDGIIDHSYVFLYFTNRRNSPYPIPELFNQLGPQDEYNITRNQIMIHRRRFNRQYTVLNGSVSDEEISKFEEGVDGAVIKTTLNGEVFRPVSVPPLDNSVYFDTQMLRQDFFDISGDSVPNAAIAGIEKTGVANLLGSRMEGRRTGKFAVVKSALEGVAMKLLSLMEKNMTIPVAITRAGEMGALWQPIHPSGLRSGEGQFVYEVDATSLVPQNPDTERNGWMALMDLVLRNPMIALSPIVLRKTARMFNVEDKLLLADLTKMAQMMIQQQQATGGSGGQPARPKQSPEMGVA